ncbi:Uncharacterized membrane protein YvbJ [Evansella caseinilytica]|uniref:Uncharacterized membrane protein YvbJ n=1 Tax=Evansella caseinilytica TaxID=1503961 RepID=A0A1H3UHC9_9BACI|nr:zinc-ribbon domain-containing protein [Evansella caseinilytica]SDZ61840.1 Uncharacterized membrane protein YvbJ [Evansella caseinilytica]
MSFCTSCGTKLETNAVFCTNCGAKLTDGEQTNTVAATRQKPPSPPLSRKAKMIIASIAAFAVLAFGMYKLGESLTDKTKQLNAFIDSIEAEDKAYLLKHLQSGHEAQKITENTVEHLLEYIQENPYVVEELYKTTTKQIENSEKYNKILSENFSKYEEKPLITFQENGKKFLIFDNYDFFLNPQPLYIYTNYPEATFFLDKEEVKIKNIDYDLVLLGNLLPGSYNIKATVDTDFLALEKELAVNFFTQSYTDLYFDVDDVYIDIMMDEAAVFINGEDTGTMITDMDGTFGPVLLDGSLKLHLEKDAPFGKIRTPEYTLNSEAGYLSAEFTLLPEQANDIFEQVNEFLLEWGTARVQRDSSNITTASGDMIAYLSSTIEDMIDWEREYTGSLLKTTFDIDSVRLSVYDNHWIAEVAVSEEWDESYHYSGNSPHTANETYERIYYLTYDEESEQWLINDFDTNWLSFDSTNIKEFSFEAGEQKSEAVDEEASLPSAAAFDELFENFISSYVRAINETDVSLVSVYIDPDAADYQKEVSNYIDHLQSKGITEEFLAVEVVHYEEESTNRYRVETSEDYLIYYNDGTEKQKSFASEYFVVQTDNGLKVSKLIQTKEK